MSAIYNWADLCILALFLLVNDSISQITQQGNFERMTKCPTLNAKVHHEKLISQIECATVCTGEIRCNKFYLEPVTKSCYLGDACSVLTQWSDGDCESFQLVKTGIQNPLFEQLQMKMFYKFKSSGLLNEVNPREFCLAANNVTVDSNGAHFRGNNGSYLSTETPGFEQFMNYGTVYSFYVQVRHVMNTGQTMYHRFMNCTSPLNTANSIARADSYVFSYAGWTQGGTVYSSSQNFMTLNGQSALLSVGYAYNRTAHQHFYSSLHPTLLAVSNPSVNPAASTNASNFQCLRLGYHHSDALCLNGTMYCYGMSTKILGFDDFKLLDAYCNT